MTRSVLMISGGSYTDVAICAQTRQLAKAGQYRFSAMGMNSTTGRPGALAIDLFEQTKAFPERNLHPPEPWANASLMWDVLRCVTARRPPWLDSGPVGESGRATLQERIRHRLRRKEWAREIPPLVSGHDLCHWHSLSPSRLPALDFIPAATPVIVTIWGSDILRTSGLEAYRLQVRACERADRITVNSLEMRELLLSRLGRQHEEKIRFASFGSDIYHRIDEARDKPAEFLTHLGVSRGKVAVCIGNNGVRPNRHEAVLALLAAVPKEVQARIAAVIPMSYGADPDYLQTVRSAAVAAPFEAHVIDQPLSAEEVAELRCTTPVLIHVPATDAFSATMCEHLYGGSVLITGAWLPYGPLRRRGVHHHAIESLRQLPERLASVLEHLEEERARTAEGARAVRALNAWDEVAPQWLAVYDELVALP